MLCAITPGPKELTADEMQHSMKLFVDDLLQLYHDGITVRTRRFPNGE